MHVPCMEELPAPLSASEPLCFFNCFSSNLILLPSALRINKRPSLTFLIPAHLRDLRAEEVMGVTLKVLALEVPWGADMGGFFP